GRFDDETDFDAGFYKVQVTPTQVSAHAEVHSQEDQPKDQLGVLSAAKIKSERVPTPSYDSPLLGVHKLGSDEERFEQHELTDNVQQQSNDLRGIKDYSRFSDYKIEIESQKAGKEEEKARTPHPMKKRLFKVRVESFAEENLDEKDPSKQGRIVIEEIDQDAGFSARRLIDLKLLPSILTPTVWVKFLSRKDNKFLWRLSIYRLPHRLNLSSRGLDIPTISYSSCNGNVESADHVFFECDLVKEIWCLVCKWCDISIPTFASYDTWNSWFFTWQATKAKSRRLYIIFAALFWWIWRYRNSVTFSSDSIKKGDLFDNIRASSFSWISNLVNVFVLHFLLSF
nr:RNA-directed DNA polymerase, eukaryota [Tanacetum cinerariifolium]